MRSKDWTCYVILLCIAISAVPASSKKDESEESKRAGKLFSMFQVVTFPNQACAGGAQNGTCYTATECTTKGGVNSGSCASGYGVCCIFSISCGGTSRQNCTYVQSSGTFTSGSCIQNICPINNNICQIRLDFTTFVIAGPSTSSLTETFITNGAPMAAGQASSFASRCLTDTFSVTNSGGTNPAPICGTNSGLHMYVDVDRDETGYSNGCNQLNFQLGATAVGTTIISRQWSIKVTQYACDSTARAPAGCTMYYLNPSDVVKTYNFDGGQHLAFQRQTICVRRARGNCRICWSATTAQDFALSGGVPIAGPAVIGSAIIKSSFCCGAGPAGMNPNGYDCLQIPGALKVTAAATRISKAMLMGSRFCGRNVGLVTVLASGAVMTNAIGANRSICSTVEPFFIRFISDGYEVAKENTVPNKGFRLAYTQSATQCT